MSLAQESERHYAAAEAVHSNAIREEREKGNDMVAKIIKSLPFRRDLDSGEIYIEPEEGVQMVLGHLGEGLEMLEQSSS